MTREQAKIVSEHFDLLGPFAGIDRKHLQAMIAFADGATLEVRLPGTDIWTDCYDPGNISFVGEYRVKPAKKRVPLTADDIPPVCWMQQDGGGVMPRLVVCVGEESIYTAEQTGFEQRYFTALMKDDWEYSTDRKTWKPCWKEVAE